MSALKTMLTIALGLGMTWMAWQIAPAGSSAMLGATAQAQSAPEAETETEEDSSAPTDEEIDAQIREIEAAIAEQGEIEEFEPTEPLPADAAIEMSSEL